MDLREQVLLLRGLLEENGCDVDDFELNVGSDVFKELMAGGKGELEVCCLTTAVAISYQYDGTARWLDELAGDLGRGMFDKEN